MGRTRIIAETGAGQHGVATATVCALFGLPCTIYMGATDVARQSPNVFRMRLLGATVTAVTSGAGTLKDAMNEAMRDWVANVADTYYLIGTVRARTPIRPWCATSNPLSGRRRGSRSWPPRAGCRMRLWRPLAAAATPWACSTHSWTMTACAWWG